MRKALAAVVLACACGPVDGSPPGIAPVNACNEDDAPCELFLQQPAPRCNVKTKTCEARVAKKDLPYTVVVTLPDSSTYRGLTYTVRSDEFPASFDPSGTTSTSVGRDRLQLGAPGRVRGRYMVSPQLQGLVGRSLFTGENTAVPTNARLRLLRDGVDFERLGLPVGPVFAVSTDVRSEDKPPGPGGVRPWTYDAIVPPGTYERVVTPEPPFDDAYPPLVGSVVVTAGSDTEGDLAGPIYGNSPPTGVPLDSPEGPRTSTFTRAGGLLDGFHASLRVRDTGRTASPVVPLFGTQTKATLNTFGFDLTALDLVVEPGPGSPLPTLIDPVTAGALKSSSDYPALPAPAKVTGVLRAEEGLVGGDVLFVSERLDTVPPDARERDYLHYSLPIQARSGTFSATLPQGRYTFYATPVGDGRLAQTSVLVTVSGSTNLEIAFPTLRRVRGRCILTNGQQLGDAEVVAKPSVSLLEGSSTLPTAAWPRPASSRTNAAGTFILALDYGTYDIFVKPRAGTHLPWVVRTKTFVAPPGEGQGDFVLETLQVPAPVRQSMSIADPNGFNVVSADVRIFRKLHDGPEFVEMGRALTDASGRVDLFLSPYDP